MDDPLPELTTADLELLQTALDPRLDGFGKGGSCLDDARAFLERLGGDGRISDSLQHWLANLAVWDDDRVAAFLDERGLDARRDPALIDRARGLFEQVATARPGLTVNTFHGWFSALLAAAPLSSGLSGQQLAERTAQLREQAAALGIS